MTRSFVLAFLAAIPAAAHAIDAQVIDGDSFRMPDGEVIRVENIDTPSIGAGAECPAERQIAARTVARVTQLLQTCEVELQERYVDRQGRTEALVSVCGQDLGELLMKEGLATMRGDFGKSWC